MTEFAEEGNLRPAVQNGRGLGKNSLGLPNPTTQWVPKKRMTVMAVLVATLGSFGLGMTLVWSAIALKYLKEGGPDLFGEITKTEESLIGSIIYLGALIAAPLTGLLISAIGRKYTMLISAIPCLIGWLLIAFAQNIGMLLIGRFITGFCGGTFTVSVPAYVSEITEDRIRGTLGTVMILMLVFGIEFTFIVGAFVDWFWLSIIASIVPVIFFIAMIFMPESPRYLIIKRRPSAARQALKWLRRASTKLHIEPEMTQIENSVTQSNSSRKTCSGDKSTLSELLKPSVLKPIGISIALMAFSQFSGMNGVSLYTYDVFESAGTKMDPKFALIIIWGSQALSVLAVTFLFVEKFGRKTLLLASQMVMIIGLVGFGFSFYFQEGGKIPEHLSFLPLTSLVTFIIGYNIGMGPIPWLVASEILPPCVREMASSIVTFCYWALSFGAGFTFIPLEGLLGNVVLYWLCAGITFVSACFVFFLLPETKGKTVEEIQKYFEGAGNGEKKQQLENKGDHFETTFTTVKADNEIILETDEGMHNPGFEEVNITSRESV